MKIKVFIFLLFLVIGCDGPTTSQEQNEHEHEHEHEHKHSHNPHYGGNLFEIGDHFAHIEVVSNNKKVVLYILDGEAENNLRLKDKELNVEITYESKMVRTKLLGVANPLTGETEDNTSQFEASLPELKDQKISKIKIENINIKGQNLKNLLIELDTP